MHVSATKTSTEKIKGSRLAFTMLHPRMDPMLVSASAIHFFSAYLGITWWFSLPLPSLCLPYLMFLMQCNCYLPRYYCYRCFMHCTSGLMCYSVGALRSVGNDEPIIVSMWIKKRPESKLLRVWSCILYLHRSRISMSWVTPRCE